MKIFAPQDILALQDIRNQLSDAENYVNSWCTSYEVTFSLHGQNTFKYNNEQQAAPLSYMFNHLWLSYEKECLNYKDTLAGHGGPYNLVKVHPTLRLEVIKETTMQKAFDARKEKAFTAQKEIAKAALRYVGPNDSLENWLKALTGKCSQLDLAVIKQFLWTVKRRMQHIYPEHIKFPIIYGKQQTGKSTAIRKLLTPLNLFKLDRAVSDILDERNTKSLGQFYVCFLDEMAGMKKVEVEALKRVVTADYLTYRPMHTNITETVFVTCSFIGASNRPLEELIFDTTGQARFWQIDASDTIDHSVINSLDYLSIWQSIDENNSAGYVLPHLKELTKIQEESTMEDFIKVFLDEMGFIPDVHDKFVAVSDVHEAYSAFCAIHGEKPKTAAWFSRTAKKYGLKSGSILKGKGRGYKVNNEFLKEAPQVNTIKKELSWTTQ